MIKYFIIISLLLVKATYAGPAMNQLQRGSGHYNCSGYDVCQNFEGTGYDNSETWTETDAGDGTIDEDYTSDALTGSQSLNMIDGGTLDTVTTTFTAHGSSDTTYLAFILEIDTDTNEALPIFVELQDSGTRKGYIALDGSAPNDGSLLAKHDGDQGDYASTTPSVGTSYCIWFEWKPDSGGGDGIGRMYITTLSANGTCTKPGSPEVNITNGNTSGNIDRVLFSTIGDQFVYTVDRVLISNSAIGNF